ncbi:TonB-dependent receptor [Thermococcus sp. JdF3]|uniref:TonB-dependent receptor n=1 Tax=Thermococcus sp. JdF3 TaxID=1638258 RepID=UPI001439D40A|nr:TonB-dependent receptor [Thermococcus sp. JdF3]
MGHTVYYRIEVSDWEGFREFIAGICGGLGLELILGDESILIIPGCRGVEPLEIRKKGRGFVKTNLIEPCHSLYLLVLHSVSSFGSVELWED